VIAGHRLGVATQTIESWRRNGTCSPSDRQVVYDGYERARQQFHRLLDAASEQDLARRSCGTRWDNRQLLWHMLFGYLVVRSLLVLVHVLGRLPRGVSRGFARFLDHAVVPFDLVNYAGPCAAVKVVSLRRMGVTFDRVIGSLHRRLAAEPERDLARGMHFPVRWDRFFTDFMTVGDIYQYPTQHFEFHRRQLTLGGQQPPPACQRCDDR
jgi:hypothetical protein